MRFLVSTGTPEPRRGPPPHCKLSFPCVAFLSLILLFSLFHVMPSDTTRTVQHLVTLLVAAEVRASKTSALRLSPCKRLTPPPPPPPWNLCQHVQTEQPLSGPAGLSRDQEVLDQRVRTQVSTRTVFCAEWTFSVGRMRSNIKAGSCKAGGWYQHRSFNVQRV